MKTSLLSIILIAFLNSAHAQVNPEITKIGIPIEMLFPEGKSKALILSYDDGRSEDRRLVKLMNKYNLIGTFHLNSNKLGLTNYLNKAEIKELFTGHEVSVHSANHPFLTTLSKIDIVYEIVEDRKELERLVNIPVRGMAYPFGNYNDYLIETIKGLGIEYARTVSDTYAFKIPKNFLQWDPTMHQFGKAYSEPNKPENDKKELDLFYQTINNFIQTKELALLDVWGHSYEIGNDEKKWNETEKFFKMISNNPNIYYAKQIDIVDYINAFNNLKFSVDKSIVLNPSSLTIFFKKDGKTYSVLSGKTILVN
ncbi:polysaccharide deacetylase family protein [Flavobacterium sp. N3904]|uniref:polysaccharide deacetylase family protein n=1 Tax=Flavobacterium sp. N3904 TaxID=2986835 RepID=UPI002223F982|nr:polysaccharide deacetylase family protein [Flavobacterium sp. N3904]